MIIIALFDINKIMNLLNLVQFIQLPFAVVPLLKMYASKEIMLGYSVSKCKLIFIIILSVVIQLFNIFSVYFVIKDSAAVWKVVVWILISFHTMFIGRCLWPKALILSVFCIFEDSK